MVKETIAFTVLLFIGKIVTFFDDNNLKTPGNN